MDGLDTAYLRQTCRAVSMNLSSEVESWEPQTKINQQKGKVINAQLIRDAEYNHLFSCRMLCLAACWWLCTGARLTGSACRGRVLYDNVTCSKIVVCQGMRRPLFL